MEQRELPSNSLNSSKAKKENRENLKPVVTGKASIKKKSFGERVADKFISKDVDSLSDYLTNKIFIPFVKKAVIDTLELIFYGRSSPKRNPFEEGEITNYNRMSRRGSSVYFLGSSSRENSSVNRKTFNDLYFEDSADGEQVWDSIRDHLSEYSNISILQVLELAGLEKQIDYPDNHYGWFSMQGMEREYSRGGMTLKLPPARYLND